MTPEELAHEVERVVGLCTERILGVGADQYNDTDSGQQKFETMPLDGLLEYYEEELRDLVNYAVMTHIRLARLREELRRRGLLAIADGEAA